MRSQQHHGRSAATALIALALLCVTSSNGAAQDTTESPGPISIAKSVALDPTTYAPAVLAYDATMLDWKSSQVFFQHGYLEHNPAFTANGLPNSLPLPYGQGNHQILMDALEDLQLSVVNNFASRLFERTVADRHPEHRKLIRVIGWVERGAFASATAYMLSAAHYQQWKANEQLARQLGY